MFEERKPTDLRISICHSGGAIGSDTTFENISMSYGCSVRAYSYKTKNHISPNKVEISDEDFNEGVIEINKVNKVIKRPGISKYINLLSRNWAQVKYSNEIFAIGYIIKSGCISKQGYLNKSKIDVIDGGTAYAVTSGILNKKPVFIFEQNLNKWFKWSYTTSSFIETNDVFISKQNFSGIGTREINKDGILAIEKLFENTNIKFNKLAENCIE
jgi:hypothetical protein